MKAAWWLGVRLARQRRTVSAGTAVVALLLAMAAGVVQTVDATSRLSSQAVRLERAGGGQSVFTFASVDSLQTVEKTAAALREAGLGVVEPAAVFIEVPLTTGGNTFTGRVAARHWNGAIFAPTLTVQQGRRPGDGGIAVTESFARINGLGLDSSLTVDGRSMTVVGIAATPGAGPTSQVVFADLADVADIKAQGSWWIVTSVAADEPKTSAIADQFRLVASPASDLRGSPSPIDQRPLLFLGLTIVVVGAVVFVVRRAAGKSLGATWSALSAVGFRWGSWRLAAAFETGVAAAAGSLSGWALAMIASPWFGHWVVAERGLSYGGVGQAPVRAAVLCLATVAVIVIAAVLEPRRSRIGGLRLLTAPAASDAAKLADRLARSHPTRARSLRWAAVIGVGAMVTLSMVVDSITASDAAAEQSQAPAGSMALNLHGSVPAAGLQEDIESLSGRPAVLVWATPSVHILDASSAEFACNPYGIAVDATAWRTLVGRDWTDGERGALESGSLIAFRPHRAEKAVLVSDTDPTVVVGSLPVFDSRPGDSAMFTCVVSVTALRGSGLTPVPSLLLTRPAGGVNKGVIADMGTIAEKHGYPATAWLFAVMSTADTPIAVQMLVILLVVVLAAYYGSTFVEAAWDDSPMHRILLGLGMPTRSRIILFMRSTVYNAFVGTVAGVLIGLLGGVLVGQSMGVPIFVVPLSSIAWSFVALGLATLMGLGTLHLYAEKSR